MTRYVTLDELLYINGRVLRDEKILRGEQKIREIERLEAAAARPAASAFGADAYPTLREKAVVLFHSIARNHPFRDGNKRTALVGMLFMLRINGQHVDWQAEDALEMVLKVAEGHVDYPVLDAWLPLVDADAAPEQDAERDVALLDEILSGHRWLLDELERR